MNYAPGQIVNQRYEIISELATGGMGVIYKVRQILLAKDFALKTLNTKAASAVVLRRFQQEARVLGKLEHPCIVAVSDFGVLEDDMPFLVMELLHGKSLSDYVSQNGPMPLAQAIPIFVQLCDGLQYAHEQGVIHRDIKPSNVMLLDQSNVDETFKIKIIDFGIVKFTVGDSDGVQGLTKTGEVFGSPLYMSPEQCQGEPVDPRSDIYSLGCLFFECLTGLPPFASNNSLTTMLKHRNEQAPTLKAASLGIDFPKQIEFIVAKMLAKQPDQRFFSMKEIRDQLKAPDATRVVHVKNSASAAKKETTKFNGKTAAIVATAITLSAAAASLLLLLNNTSSRSNKLPKVQSDKSKVVDQSVKFSVANHDTEIGADSTIDGDTNHQNAAPSNEEEPPDAETMATELTRLRARLSKLENSSLALNDKILNSESISLIATKHLEGLTLYQCQLVEPRLDQLTKITELKFVQTRVNQKELEEVCKLTKLISLTLSDTGRHITDLSPITKLGGLLYVDLTDSIVDDKTIKVMVSKIPKLDNLLLTKCERISNQGLVALSGTQVTKLFLDETNITDAGLLPLAKMKNLSLLNLENTRVTTDGITKFCRSTASRGLTDLWVAKCAKISAADLLQLQSRFSRITFVQPPKKSPFLD